MPDRPTCSCGAPANECSWYEWRPGSKQWCCISCAQLLTPPNERTSRARLIEIITELYDENDLREMGIGDCLINEIHHLLYSEAINEC